MIHLKLAIWSRVPLPFLKPAWVSGISLSTYCSILFCMIFSSTLLVWDIRAIVLLFAHSLASPFFGIGMYMDFFKSLGHLPVAHTPWHRAKRALTASSPAALNNSMGRPSSPGALLWLMSFSASRTLLSSIVGSCTYSAGSNLTVIFLSRL